MKTTKQILLIALLACLSQIAFAQSTILGNTRPGFAAYVGWNGLGLFPGSLEVRNNFAGQPINFFTGGAQRMTILGSGGPTAGFVGIGANSLAPTFQLSADDDININTTYSSNANNQLGFRINGQKILNNPGFFNVFVGVGAGLSNAFSSNGGVTASNFNSFLGHEAGRNNTVGGENTFIGESAGLSNISGDHNTFIGRRAGANNTTGSNNTYVGAHTSQGPITGAVGNDNTVLGYFAGDNTINGDKNVIVGAQAGRNNNWGGSNAFFGFGAGRMNQIGNGNTYLGHQSTTTITNNDSSVSVGIRSLISSGGFTGLVNAIAIGARCTTRISNTLILGNNKVNVGIGLSNDPIGPQNKLEINTALPNSNSQNNNIPGSIAGSTGASGLRFTDLTSSSTPQSNPSNNYLSVNSLGDVILVKDSLPNNTLASALLCPGLSLTGNSGFRLNNNNFYFIGSSPIGNNGVSIGQACGSPLKGKFQVYQQSNLPPVSNYLSIGNLTTNNDASSITTQTLIAVYGETSTVDEFPNRPTHTGGAFYGKGGYNNYGVYCEAGLGSGRNFALYATVNPGLNNYAAWFNGDVFINNPTVGLAGNVLTTSDQNLKKGIDTISNAISIVNSLKPKTFFMDTANIYNLKFSNQRSYGLLAQDVELVLPELVGTSYKPAELDSMNNVIYPSVTYKNLNYTGLIGILIKAVQEQSQKISQLENTINSCCNATAAKTTEEGENLEKLPTYNVNIGNDDLPMLAQNIPNPYGNTTNIQFNIPKNAQSAQIVFFNEQGMILNSVEINTKGRGQINLNAEKLENGLYFYSLIIDGKKVDTKKMVKAE